MEYKFTTKHKYRRATVECSSVPAWRRNGCQGDWGPWGWWSQCYKPWTASELPAWCSLVSSHWAQGQPNPPAHRHTDHPAQEHAQMPAGPCPDFPTSWSNAPCQDVQLLDSWGLYAKLFCRRPVHHGNPAKNIIHSSTVEQVYTIVDIWWNNNTLFPSYVLCIW